MGFLSLFFLVFFFFVVYNFKIEARFIDCFERSKCQRKWLSLTVVWTFYTGKSITFRIRRHSLCFILSPIYEHYSQLFREMLFTAREIRSKDIFGGKIGNKWIFRPKYLTHFVTCANDKFFREFSAIWPKNRSLPKLKQNINLC